MSGINGVYHVASSRVAESTMIVGDDVGMCQTLTVYLKPESDGVPTHTEDGKVHRISWIGYVKQVQRELDICVTGATVTFQDGKIVVPVWTASELDELSIERLQAVASRTDDEWDRLHPGVVAALAAPVVDSAKPATE